MEGVTDDILAADLVNHGDPFSLELMRVTPISAAPARHTLTPWSTVPLTAPDPGRRAPSADRSGMSRGRIHPDDIALVRANVPIEDVVSERVTLRASGGNMTGLCPFHDDSSPSFSVSPSRGLWTCFGCGLGGDIISFVQEAEGLPFVEALHRLAERGNIELRYLDADPGFVAPPPGQRARLVAANTAAKTFFMSKLPTGTEAAAGRAYLTERNFDEASWAQFSVGFAPNSRDELLRHLTTSGFTTDEVVLAGLAVQNADGRIYDRFRGRLIWPIHDLAGDTIGFGARRLTDDDKGPKWLNTPDTPLYRKSEVLYGIDLARREMAASKAVVVVEGYGDVMAAHLAGVTNAVATCGTSFGDGHIRIVRRLMRDDDVYAGKVIFTFDGDAAGQKAALRAFKEHSKFTAQTFVAVAPDGMDPCDLRLRQGDQAVRDLVAGAIPLVEFAMRSALAGFDLSTTEGRISALRATTPLIAGIKDTAMQTEYARRLSGWLALPDHTVRSALAAAVRQGAADASHAAPDQAAPGSVTPGWRPDPLDAALTGEREAAKCVLQSPEEFDQWLDGLDPETFTSSAYRGIFSLAFRVRGEALDPAARLHAIREQASGDPSVAAFVNELAMEPLHGGTATAATYGHEVMSHLMDKYLERQGATLRAQLSDAAPADQAGVLAQILAIETRRRQARLAR